jgi:hypothetical protein
MTLTAGAYHSSAEWPEVEAVPGVHRRVLSCGDAMMIVQFRIAQGAEVPAHSHPHEQIGHVVSGRMTFRIGDEEVASSMAPKASPIAWLSIASTRCVRTIAEARERAQLILGAISLVVWFAVAFGLAVTWVLQGQPDSRIILAGTIALAVAATPWLGYRHLVRRLTKQSRGTR